MAKANDTGAPAPKLPKHPFIADTLAETVLNIDSLLAVVESHFDASEDDPHPTSAAYLTGQLLIVQATRQDVIVMPRRYVRILRYMSRGLWSLLMKALMGSRSL